MLGCVLKLCVGCVVATNCCAASSGYRLVFRIASKY
jgi:hypothetical protein